MPASVIPAKAGIRVSRSQRASRFPLSRDKRKPTTFQLVVLLHDTFVSLFWTFVASH